MIRSCGISPSKNIFHIRCETVLFTALLVLSLTQQHCTAFHAPVASTRIRHHRQYTPLTTFDSHVSNDLSLSSSVSLPNSDKNANNLHALSSQIDPANDHRYAASEWLHNLRSLPRSTILRAIRGPILAVMAWSTIVSLVYKVALKQQWTRLASTMCVSSAPHSFLVSALGLLLVFRTNSAYQRFTEGRKIWEQILSVSRSISRLVFLYPAEISLSRRRRVLRMLAAFPYLLHQHIQPPPGEIDRSAVPWCLFPDKALQKCLASANRPLWVCDRLCQEFTNVVYTPNFTSRERLTLLSKVDRLSQCVGECERIHQTAVPLNYARHSLRSLTLWLFTLPFCLIQDFGLLTAPVMGLTSWLLFGIYQIGFTIEDPFQGSLRLSALCDAIFCDVMHDTDLMKRRMTAFDDHEQGNRVQDKQEEEEEEAWADDIDTATTLDSSAASAVTASDEVWSPRP